MPSVGDRPIGDDRDDALRPAAARAAARGDRRHERRRVPAPAAAARRPGPGHRRHRRRRRSRSRRSARSSGSTSRWCASTSTGSAASCTATSACRRSTARRSPASSARSSTVSAPLVLASTVLSIVVAVPLGIVAGARHRQADGVALSVVSQLGIAVPSFWAGSDPDRRVRRQLGPASRPRGFPRDGWDDPGRAVAVAGAADRDAGAGPGRGAAAVRALGDARRAAPGLHPHGPGQGADPHPGAVPPRAAQRVAADHLDPRRADRQPDRRRRRHRAGVQPARASAQMLVKRHRCRGTSRRSRARCCCSP